MKRYASHVGLLLLGALALELGEGCTHQESMALPRVAETQSAAPSPAGPSDVKLPEAKPPEETPAPATTEPELATPTPGTAPPIEPPGGAMSPAKAVTNIEVQRQADGVEVIITGDGVLTYQISRLQGKRLVVDLPEVVNELHRNLVPVRDPLLKQIRIGSHTQPARVRLVLDLTRDAPYTVEKTGTQLKVLLSETRAQAGLPEGATPGSSAMPQGEKLIPPPIVGAAGPYTEQRRIQNLMAFPAQPKLGQSVAGSTPEGVERYSGKRISLDFQDAEISSVLRLIADVSGFNMVVGEGAKAKVTLKLLNVPWDQALDLILKLNQLGQIREGNIIWIDSLSNIAKLKEEAVRAHESTVKAEPLGTRIIYLNYADATKTVDIVKSNLTPRGEAKVDIRTNAVVVKDIAETIAKVEKLLRDIDRVTPQVQIEARIVQASKKFARGLGVQWGISGMTGAQNNPAGVHHQGPVTVNLGATGDAFSQASSFLVNLPATATGLLASNPATFGLAIGKFLGTSGTLDLRLSAGESLGVTKIVSSPKIITLDHKPAKIEQGSQVPFQTTSLQGTQTTFVDATLTLNVTPHVIPLANTIRLEIKATKNSVGASVSSAGPTIDKKEATTEVLLRDGETTVLGGIFEETRSDSTQGIPWFNRIPFLGWLFKTEAVSLDQTELLVFVTPTILKE